MSSKAKRKKPSRRRGISLKVTIAMMLLVGSVLAWRGFGFYVLDLDSRVDHEDFRLLRPSGDIGYAYGIVGTILIFANLLYLARRRFARWQLGSMRTWLDLHVFTGLVGATFVSFHASFQARSWPNRVTAISLTIVLVTGIVGRYLYALIRRPEIIPFKDTVEALETVIPDIGAQVTAAVKANPVPRSPGDPSLIRTIRSIPAWLRSARTRRQAVELIVFNHPVAAAMAGRQRARLYRLTRRACRAAAAEVLSVGADEVLRLWRPMHRFFAILMLITVIIHIVVAWIYGYRWIFSE